MRVNKWFPTVSELSTYLRAEGWTVESISSAPKILATSQDLAEGYQLGKKEIFRIRDEISLLYGEAPGMFVATPDGFMSMDIIKSSLVERPEHNTTQNPCKSVS